MAIITEICKRKRKAVNKLAIVHKLIPYNLFGEISSNMPLLRYSFFKKLYGYECWWTTEESIIKILETNNEPIVILNLIKNLNDAIANGSKFILKKLKNKIDHIKKLIDFRKKHRCRTSL
ncbi:MAG: hypothetical protein ACFFDN_00245 [Candidatus Hodarchaeota archaeon]